MEKDSITQSDHRDGRYSPESERRRSFLSLRWLVVILASYLTLFSHLSSSNFPILFVFDLAFAATNVVFALMSDASFGRVKVRRALAVLDAFFITGTFYVLRVPNTYFYVAFGLVFVLAVVWQDLRLVLLSLLTVSLLFGAFSAFRIAQFELTVNIEQFLTLSLFFVVTIFYVFLSQQFDRDAKLSRSILDDKRRAEVLVEMTRSVSSSLKSDEVLHLIVDRLCDVMRASDCAILQVDPKTGETLAMARNTRGGPGKSAIDFNTVPTLREAYEQRQMVFRNSAETSVAALPMISQDAVVGVIYFAAKNKNKNRRFSEDEIRFFEVVASTAANGLNNATMFEEVERKARTDFMTGLANFRFFQTTLSAELGRAERHLHPLSLLMIDLDYLKQVNDRFGHPTGDLVIRTVADAILQNCRAFDFAARYGGEEFSVILPETALDDAILVAERIRQKIAQIKFQGLGNVTASIGVSNYPSNALNQDDLIRVADQALYLAKRNGRDRAAYFRYELVT